ncbi:MAG TPA: allantoicase [Candidatus Nitrosotenuis sp.]|nr:allantoicase [Candidatus Nitrosotenuis sp.]
MSDHLELVDLAQERLGGQVLAASDDFFAPKENLLRSADPVWDEHRYTDRGKWMDGWETRRRRQPGHDWCILRLGLPGVIRSLVVDTAYFRGNYPEQCSLEGCALAAAEPWQEARWVEILPPSPLRGDSRNSFSIDFPYRVTHLRFNIFPDGGVARLRVYGEGVPDWMIPGQAPEEMDLAALENGGLVLSCSDMFFGSRHNLIMPGHATHMGDGWETRRRRGPGHDWVILQLATTGIIEQVDFDTSHFKGNAPGSTMLEVCHCPGEFDPQKAEWRELLPPTEVHPHRLHRFHRRLRQVGAATHLRVNIYPDGGVARLRAYGVPTEEGRMRAALRWLNTLLPQEARAHLRRCCGSARWVEKMLAGRPYADVDSLYQAAHSTWWALGEEDWREAFAAHPPIGARQDEGRQDEQGSRWSRQEQAGALGAPASVLEALAEANRQYLQRFGFLFIICASGKGAQEMLDNLRERLANDPSRELRIAAQEQARITRLRLEKLLKG